MALVECILPVLYVLARYSRQAFCPEVRQSHASREAHASLCLLAWALSADPSCQTKAEDWRRICTTSRLHLLLSLTVCAQSSRGTVRQGLWKVLWTVEAGTGQHSSVRTFCSITRPSHFLSSSCSSLLCRHCLCSDQVPFASLTKDRG